MVPTRPCCVSSNFWKVIHGNGQWQWAIGANFLSLLPKFLQLWYESAHISNRLQNHWYRAEMVKCQQAFHSSPPRNNWWARPVARCTPLTEKTFNLRLLNCFFLAKTCPYWVNLCPSRQLLRLQFSGAEQWKGIKVYDGHSFCCQRTLPLSVSVHFGWCLSWRHG